MSRVFRCLCLNVVLATTAVAGGQAAGQDEPFVDTSADCFETVGKLVGPSFGPYRAPREEDVSRHFDRWGFVREEYGVQATCIRWDFNSDGKPDYASVLIRGDERGFAVVVFTAQGDGSYAPDLLIEDQGYNQSTWQTQLTLLKPGHYQEIFRCSPYEEQRPVLDVPLFAIQFWVRTQCSRGRPEHWLFHWRVDGGYERRLLCTTDVWQQLVRSGKESAGCLSACACDAPHWEVERGAVASASYPLAGFWKSPDCSSGPFGLAIGPMGTGKYYVSFCGPGGCFQKGTYRPVTTLYNDPHYRVIDDNTIEIVDRSGERWVRCPRRE